MRRCISHGRGRFSEVSQRARPKGWMRSFHDMLHSASLVPGVILVYVLIMLRKGKRWPG